MLKCSALIVLANLSTYVYPPMIKYRPEDNYSAFCEILASSIIIKKGAKFSKYSYIW